MALLLLVPALVVLPVAGLVILHAAGLEYVARLFQRSGERKRATQARLLILPLLVLIGLAYRGRISGPVVELVDVMAVALRLWAFSLLWRLRRMLLVDAAHWWFDSEMEPPGEWVGLLVHRDKHAEVLCVDEALGWFASTDEATEWLVENGYVPAARALEERLVNQLPPDPMKAARRRKRLRAPATSPAQSSNAKACSPAT